MSPAIYAQEKKILKLRGSGLPRLQIEKESMTEILGSKKASAKVKLKKIGAIIEYPPI